MLVQARGMLVAVRLVPTPSLTDPLSSLLLAPFLLPLVPPASSDFEYRSGLSCGCVAVVELTTVLTRVLPFIRTFAHTHLVRAHLPRYRDIGTWP